MLSTQDSRNGIDHALLDVVRDNLGLEEVLLPGCVNQSWRRRCKCHLCRRRLVSLHRHPSCSSPGTVRAVARPCFFALSAPTPRSRSSTAQNLLENWNDGDPGTTAVAEVIASAFASGLSWGGHLGGTEVYCPPPDLGGREIMSAFGRFLKNNPDMAGKPYGAAMRWPFAGRFLADRRRLTKRAEPGARRWRLSLSPGRPRGAPAAVAERPPSSRRAIARARPARRPCTFAAVSGADHVHGTMKAPITPMV